MASTHAPVFMGPAPASLELAMAHKDVLLAIASAHGAPLSVLPGVGSAMAEALDEGHGARDYTIFALDRR